MRKFFLVTLMVGLLGGIAGAQPDPNAAPVGANPPNATAVAPETAEAKQKRVAEVMKKVQDQMAEMMKMTPEQQMDMVRKMQEQAFRTQMTGFGFKDEALQNTILEFIGQQEKDREQVRQTASKLYEVMGGKNGVPDQGVAILLENYLNAAEDAKDRRDAAIQALDAKIGFSKDPQLAAFLNIQGIVGDAAFMTGGVLMMGNMSLASMAGVKKPVAPPK